MGRNNTIETYRRRIAIAALHRMKRKTGGYCIVINHPKGEIQTVDINQDAMQKLLMRFENNARAEFGIEASKFLRQTYMNSLDINGHTEYLTETGKMIVDDLLGEIVTYARAQYKAGGTKQCQPNK